VCTRGSNRAAAAGPSTSPLERSMRNRFLLGAIVGTVVFVLCQHFLSHWLAPVLINASVGYPRPFRWGTVLGALGGVLDCISMLLPGVCAGFISGRRGFLVGAVVGLVGIFIYGAIFEFLQIHSGLIRLNARTWPVLFTIPIFGIGQVITSTVAGGAGELLRSNHRWRVP